jgi:hypothetical protein
MNRDLDRLALLFKIWFGVAFSLIFVIFFAIVFSIYTLVTDPGVVGRITGEVVSEYNESVK